MLTSPRKASTTPVILLIGARHRCGADRALQAPNRPLGCRSPKTVSTKGQASIDCGTRDLKKETFERARTLNPFAMEDHCTYLAETTKTPSVRSRSRDCLRTITRYVNSALLVLSWPLNRTMRAPLDRAFKPATGYLPGIMPPQCAGRNFRAAESAPRRSARRLSAAFGGAGG